MLYVVLSICCSVIVSVLFKMAKRYQVDIYQVITWNYSAAIILTWLFLKPQLNNLGGGPFYIYASLGLLLPSLFVIIALSIRFSGIVRTEVAQRLSLFIPIIAAFLLFGEALSALKIIGILIGFAAIICSIPWQKNNQTLRNRGTNSWVYMLIIFIGMGVVDVLFKQMALNTAVSYNTSLFLVYVIAFVLALIGLIWRFTAKQSKFNWPYIFFGWILGLANFGNILFYIKAHQALATNPSIVFAAMNIGVIILGAFIGLALFKEKLTTLNKIGIGLALIAIGIIYYSQLH